VTVTKIITMCLREPLVAVTTTLYVPSPTGE
jgi:hypothetical protein